MASGCMFCECVLRGSGGLVGNRLIRKTSTSTSEVALDSVHFSDEETETQTLAQDELVIEPR